MINLDTRETHIITKRFRGLSLVPVKLEKFPNILSEDFKNVILFGQTFKHVVKRKDSLIGGRPVFPSTVYQPSTFRYILNK